MSAEVRVPAWAVYRVDDGGGHPGKPAVSGHFLFFIFSLGIRREGFGIFFFLGSIYVRSF